MSPASARRRGVLLSACALAVTAVTAVAVPGVASTAGSSSHKPSSGSLSTTAAPGWKGDHARVRWARRGGPAGAGALAITTGASTGRVASPAFRVHPGGRYFASARARTAGGAGLLAVGLEFADSRGRAIASGAQLGQAWYDGADGWTSVSPVAGFAPPGASTGRVVVVSMVPHLTQIVQISRTAALRAPARLVGPLTTRGRDILDARHHRVVLRGIQVEGLAGARVRPRESMTTDIDAAHAWGANYIRLAVSADRWLAVGCGAVSYRQDVQQIVEHATALGMLLELDFHSFNLAPCARPQIPPLPDQRGAMFWRQVAMMFASNPLVAFDLYNEPHDISDAAWLNGGPAKDDGVPYTGLGMQQLYDIVRATGARNLVFISGPHWDTVPVPAYLSHTFNAVYTGHIYTCPEGLPPKANCYGPGPGGIIDPTGRLHWFTPMSLRVPFVADEFGFPSTEDGRFNAAVIAWAESHHFAGWCVYAMDGSTRGLFDLVRNLGRWQDPAISGMPVMVGLARN